MSAGIREVVTSEKADLLNTGTVKDAEGQSASTLAQREAPPRNGRRRRGLIQAAPNPRRANAARLNAARNPIGADRHPMDVTRKPAQA